MVDSTAGYANGRGPIREDGREEIAHCWPPAGGTVGIMGTGGAGLPEHIDPEQGTGCRLGISSWGWFSAPAQPSNSRWAEPVVRELEVT